MKNILIVGAGRFGVYTAEKLRSLGHQIMAVDRDEERIRNILPYVTDAQIGDCASQEFIESLGVPDYDLCIVAIGDDFLNSLEITSMLSEHGAQFVVARASSASQEKFLLRNGANAVVFPERQLASWTAIRYSSSNISNYIELMDGYSVVEILVPKAWDGKNIGEINVRQKYGINILGVRNGSMNMDISTGTILHHGQNMLILGKLENIQKLFNL